MPQRATQSSHAHPLYQDFGYSHSQLIMIPANPQWALWATSMSGHAKSLPRSVYNIDSPFPQSSDFVLHKQTSSNLLICGPLSLGSDCQGISLSQQHHKYRLQIKKIYSVVDFVMGLPACWDCYGLLLYILIITWDILG